MYILLNNNTVSEIIPDIDPVFPGIPIESRYAAKFVAQLLHVADDVEVQQNWVYDPESGVFSAPPEPEPVEPAPDPGPTTEDCVADLEAENKLLKAQVEALTETNDFHEELIVELAQVVYA